MSFHAIVLGLGIMGSAAVYQLATRGLRVLGLDAFERGHEHGSSHGTSRAIRKAYFQAPQYVPLVERAYTMWRQLEAESSQELLRVTGSLLVGPPDSGHIAGTISSALRNGLRFEVLTQREVSARFPGFRLHDNLTAVLEPSGGVLNSDRCLDTLLSLAQQRGAQLRHGEPVRHWAADGDGLRVETDLATYRADRLIIAAGPWAGAVLAELDLPLSVRRVVNIHVTPTRPELYAADSCPTFAMAVPEGEYYGMPDQGVKIGRGDIGELCTPETVRRTVDPGEIASFMAVLERYLPGARGQLRSTLTCLYTMTPDKHFVIDLHPNNALVAFACGFSGHGFKFAPVIGEVLADLVTKGRTAQP
ncbi:MAG: N-methyl-L-tryptophan oxidase, partial [Chloroflexi bacterium]|nr:N-methyl-L-tryptophan oxidase [Chloroflexota bacterium]